MGVINVIKEFPEKLQLPVAHLVEAIIEATKVSREEFSDLKQIVKELAEAQKKTEQRVEELAEVQKKTEQRVEELAEAQKKTEQRVEELAEAQKRTEEEIKILARGLKETRAELGGMARTMGYAFENEAYRNIPHVLSKKYGIIIKERMLRLEVGGKEINIFGKAEKEGRDVFVVGEAKLRLDLRREKDEENIFEDLEEKVRIVKNEFGEAEIVKIVVCHFATNSFIKEAENKGIIVVQSYEW